jgi:hypothetical protein
VDVAGNLLELESVELLPGPLALGGDHPVDSQRPVGRLDLGGWPGRQHREARLHVLARRHSVGDLVRRAPAAGEPAGDELAHASSLFAG